VPGIGFAIGQDRLVEILPETFKAKIKPGVDYYIVPVSPNELIAAFDLAARLRRKGCSTGVALDGKGLKKGLKFAAGTGAVSALILGEEELKTGEVVVKYLNTGEQVRKKIDEL